MQLKSGLVHWLRTRYIALLVLAFVAFVPKLGVVGADDAPITKSDAARAQTEAIVQVPRGERWLRHMKEDLLSFYLSDAAIGTPPGNFPTFRCDDGSLFDPENPCSSFQKLNTEEWKWIKEGIRRDYVRMKSRQIFLYCVAFHMAGDEHSLRLAAQGVQYLKQHYLDEDGIPYSYREGAETGPPQLERTSQDLAYALNGLAFYYYLTRDPEVLAILLHVKDHIFDKYYDPKFDMIKWVAQDPPHQPSHFRDTARQELVAQLDQINAYMLLTTPFLPEPEKNRWQRDMIHLCDIMIRDFYSPREKLFWGSIHDDSGRRLGSRHTDFGHTVKTLWMIERVGRLTENERLIQFAEPKAPEVFASAFLPDEGTWASKRDQTRRIVKDKEWWIHAELDQAAATWSLRDASTARYLPRSYAFWLDKFVDHKHHEIWHMITAKGEHEFPKAHLWKNGFHSSEHALIGYITAQELYDEETILYFAPLQNITEPPLRPYLFAGEIVKTSTTAFRKLDGMRKLKVTFRNVR